MQDRTSKYPGRVKLLPVAGQENIYDMTRADDPDDTGTPFNKRTMLQDSTAQLLKLPLANPFVDDALRHMVDRVVPIGTIQTSPAQSLGDAWLKCDGSMVTFENYPQLCSILKNTSGSTWAQNAFPSTYTSDIDMVTEPVYFDGKWIVAIQYIAESSNGYSPYTQNIKILSTESLNGTWVEEKSITRGVQYNPDASIALTASDNYCVLAFAANNHSGQSDDEDYIKFSVREPGNATWTEIDPTNVKDAYGYSEVAFRGFDHCGDRFAILVVCSYTGSSDSAFIISSDTPKIANSWEVKTSLDKTANKLSCANSKWFVQDDSENKIKWADNMSLFDFKDEDYLRSYFYAPWSKVVFYSGMYRTFSVGETTKDSKIHQTADLSSWQTVELNEDFYAGDDVANDAYAAATENMMTIATMKKIATTANPSDGVSVASIPSVDVCGLAMRGMTAVASTKTGILYHDYTYDSRLLPTISLSDDTTTFIKAKNELDVFEAQAGGD